MKLITIILFSVLMVNPVFSQSKKDLEKDLVELQEKTKNLEREIENLNTNLSATISSLELVSKNNLDLNKVVKDQDIIIEKLIKQKDSLLLISNANKNAGFVSSPMNVEDSIVFVIQSYFSSKKWEDRLDYVLNPSIVKPLMNSYYTDNFKSNTINKNIISIQGENHEINELFKVIIDGDYILYLKKTVDGFKIDWEASTGQNPISMKIFIAQSNSKPAIFRVKAEIGDYYNFNYRDAKNTHWNITINDNHYNVISGCYVSKSSEEGEKIYQILKDGKQHHLILEIKMDNSGKNATITKVIKEGWSYE